MVHSIYVPCVGIASDRLSEVSTTEGDLINSLVGDHPVYVIIILLKAENPNK